MSAIYLNMYGAISHNFPELRGLQKDSYDRGKYNFIIMCNV